MIGGLSKSSTVALIAAAGLFAGGVAMPSANAADLGGDCCADLEERVAELEATTARKGNRRVSLTISGQVNTLLMAWDDGTDSAAWIADNGVSRSAFSFDGNARITPNLTAGFQLVIGLAAGARSHVTTQIDDDGGAGGDGTLGVEIANWYLDHKQLGRLTVGRINSASSGTSIVDLGGSGVIANANTQLWAGNFFVRKDSLLTNGSGNINSGGANDFRWSTLMGGSTIGISALSRQNGVSYTTPTIGGFSLQVAAGEADAVDDGFWDVAARYAGEHAGFRFAAALSYGRNAGNTSDAEDAVAGPLNAQLFGNGADIRKWQGSASLLHVSSGLFISGTGISQSYHGTSAGELNTFTGGGLVAGDNRPDTTMWYLLGGIAKNWTGLGNTVLYGEYGRIDGGADGLTTNGGDSIFNSEVTWWGIGVVQNIDAAAMELFLSYRQYNAAFDSLAGAPYGTGGDLDELNVVMSGARIRF